MSSPRQVHVEEMSKKISMGASEPTCATGPGCAQGHPLCQLRERGAEGYVGSGG
jgi:hypothetical protein